MAGPTRGYTTEPEIPREIAERYELVLAVLARRLTVSEAARRMGVSRNHFQTVLHRAQEGLIQGLTPRPPGPVPPTPEEAQLATENEQLERENRRLRSRVETIDRLLGVASDLIQGRVKASGRTRRARPPQKGATGDEGDDPDGCSPRACLEGAKLMRALGLTAILAAAVVGIAPSTLRRWAARARLARPLVEPRSACAPAAAPSPAAQQARALVRATRGLVGADAIRHRVPGLSRRQAAVLKHEELRSMECDRRQRATRVTVTACGIVRGFDAMHVATLDGVRYLLAAADGATPYRTSLGVVPRYTGPSVAAALERDFDQAGAPLVVRLDRASSHDVDEVAEVLADRGVLAFHGPPYCGRFYGQLERQNREHRAWLDQLGPVTAEALEAEAQAMAHALNALWPRRTLDWRTAQEVWNARPVTDIDRAALRDEVVDQAARIERHLDRPGQPADLGWRLAVEQVLTRRGYLRLEPGGWC